MTHESQQARRTKGAWMLAFPVFRDGTVGKWLNPVPSKGNSLVGYVGSNPTSASRKVGTMPPPP
jgi:hypothetical protein